MPNKNGIETMLDILEAHRIARFIAVSGDGWCGSEVEFDMTQTLGAITLEKPFRREKLLNAIKLLQK